ncbi:MAG: hypothetical protein ACRDOZ_00500, partial [Nocardioides sp.]
TWIDHVERSGPRPSDHAALVADFRLPGSRDDRGGIEAGDSDVCRRRARAAPNGRVTRRSSASRAVSFETVTSMHGTQGSRLRPKAPLSRW